MQSIDRPGAAVEDSPPPVLLRIGGFQGGRPPTSKAGVARKRPQGAEPGRRPAPARTDSDPPRAEEAKPLPFAMIPHDFAADGRLTALDVRVLLALLYFAKADDHCWPSVKALRERVHVKSDRSVQESLRRLIEFGYIRRDDDPTRPTWREFVLLWRRGEWPVPILPDRRAAPAAKKRRPPPQEIAPPPAANCGGGRTGLRRPPPREIAPDREASLVVGKAEEKHRGEAAAAAPQVGPTPDARPVAGKTEERDGSLISNENENETASAQPLSPEMRQTLERLLGAGGNAAAQARKHLARDDAARAMAAAAGGGTMMTSPKPIERMGPGELKARIATLLTNSKASPETIALLEGLGPGCDPRQVDLCVRRLCRELDGDGHSQGYFVETLNSVRRGQIPAEAIVHAYVRACGPKVRKPDAAFVRALQTT